MPTSALSARVERPAASGCDLLSVHPQVRIPARADRVLVLVGWQGADTRSLWLTAEEAESLGRDLVAGATRARQES